MNAYDWGWLIGILEGEGCFGLYGTNNGNKYPDITVKSTDKDTIENIIKIIGVGTIKGPIKVKTYKPLWVWSIRGKKALALMLEVYPYMGERRKIKIEEIVKQKITGSTAYRSLPSRSLLLTRLDARCI